MANIKLSYGTVLCVRAGCTRGLCAFTPRVGYILETREFLLYVRCKSSHLKQQTLQEYYLLQ